jgi:clan AA aspartic protease (TIGR02281 family)
MRPAIVTLAVFVCGCSDTWAAGPSESAPVFANSREPDVHVVLNGEGPFRFLVDTGANCTSLTERAASRLGLALEGEHVAHGVRGTETGHFAVVDRIVVGGVEARNIRVSVLPSLGGELDGILGYDFLKNFRTTFDYPAGRVTFEPP